MRDKIPGWFAVVYWVLLLTAIAIGLLNALARPNPNVSEWLSYVSIGLCMAALFVYGMTLRIKIAR